MRLPFPYLSSPEDDKKLLAEIQRRDTAAQKHQAENTRFYTKLFIAELERFAVAGGKVTGVLGVVPGGIIGGACLAVADMSLLVGGGLSAALTIALGAGATGLVVVADTVLIIGVIATGILAIVPATCEINGFVAIPSAILEIIPDVGTQVDFICEAAEIGLNLGEKAGTALIAVEHVKWIERFAEAGAYLTAIPGALIGAIFSPIKMLQLAATRHFHYDSAAIEKACKKLDVIKENAEKSAELIKRITQRYRKDFFTSDSSRSLIDTLVSSVKTPQEKTDGIQEYLTVYDDMSSCFERPHKNNGKELFNIIVEEIIRFHVFHEKRDDGVALLALLGKNHLLGDAGGAFKKLCPDVIGLIGEYLSVSIEKARAVWALDEKVASMRMRLEAQKKPNGTAAAAIHQQWHQFASSHAPEDLKHRKENSATPLQVFATAVKEYEKQTTGMNFFFTRSSVISKTLLVSIKNILASNTMKDDAKIQMMKKDMQKIIDINSSDVKKQWEKGRLASILKQYEILDVLNDAEHCSTPTIAASN